MFCRAAHKVLSPNVYVELVVMFLTHGCILMSNRASEPEIWKIAAVVAELSERGGAAPVLYVSGEEVSTLLSQQYIHLL